jgi:hypothetical protein
VRTRTLDRINALPWGLIALGATAVSLIGYVVQTILDYVPEPALVGELEFYGVFAGFGFLALIAGLLSIAVGWRHGDKHAVQLGLVAIVYVVLAQVLQSLWD